jgi:signal transduction histidine kinase
MLGSGVVMVELSRKRLLTLKRAVNGDIPPGDYVELAVIDAGKGIEPRDLQYVFEPFFTTKPRGEGTGLGLALVYQIVKSHRGFIDLS